MANLDFFAAEADQKALIDFLFAATDVRVFESYSEPDAELREFCSLDEIAATFPLGIDPHGNGNVALLQLWSPSIMCDLTIIRFNLDPAACKGHTFRHRIDGGGLIQLYLGGVHERIVTRSHFGHFSEKGARKWAKATGVNWEALATISNQIQYHIRNRLAAAKVRSCPVLRHAYDLATSGYDLKMAVQTPWSYQLDASS